METKKKSGRGGARPGAGRPKGTTGIPRKPKYPQRTEVFLGSIRLTKIEMNKIKSRIRKSGLSQSEWARRKLLG